MKRVEELSTIVDYCKSGDYLCDIYNDLAQARMERDPYDTETDDEFIAKRQRYNARQEAIKMDLDFTEAELDYYFPLSYPNLDATAYMMSDDDDEDDDLPF